MGREGVYRHPKPILRADAAAAFAVGTPDAVNPALVDLAFNDPDWEWVQAQLFLFAEHPSPNIRGAAAICFGHLARIHRRLDVERVVPLLKRLRADPEVGASAYHALTDIRQFIPSSRALIGNLDE